MRQASITVGATIAVPILSANAEAVTAIIQADSANAVPVYLGDPKVVPAGIGLRPGQAQAVYLGAGQDLYGISTAAGQVVRVLSAQSPTEFAAFGRAQVEGVDAPGTLPTGNPIVAGTYERINGSIRTLGSAISNGIADNANNYVMLDTFSPLYNGAGWDRPRTPIVFKNLSAVVITAETTIWTPAGGKKFRLMGYALAQGVASGAVVLKDNTAGTTIFTIPQHTIGVAQVSPPMGNGILSAAANNVLTATGIATETITGVVFGTEE